MLLYYSQVNGCFYAGKRQLGVGYSGIGEKLNNKDDEAVIGGPIPRGRYFVSNPVDHPHLGPLSFPLSPIEHNAHGRLGFYIHGPHQHDHHDSSHGCIVLQYGVRQILADRVQGGEHELIVF